MILSYLEKARLLYRLFVYKQLFPVGYLAVHVPMIHAAEIMFRCGRQVGGVKELGVAREQKRRGLHLKCNLQ